VKVDIHIGEDQRTRKRLSNHRWRLFGEEFHFEASLRNVVFLGSFSPRGKEVFTFALMREIISRTEESCLSSEKITYHREVSRRQVPADYLYEALDKREECCVKILIYDPKQ